MSAVQLISSNMASYNRSGYRSSFSLTLVVMESRGLDPAGSMGVRCLIDTDEARIRRTVT
jgi:hypothetical protein